MVASDTWDPRFEPRHRENVISQIIYQLYHRKEKKKKSGREWPIFKRNNEQNSDLRSLGFFFLFSLTQVLNFLSSKKFYLEKRKRWLIKKSFIFVLKTIWALILISVADIFWWIWNSTALVFQLRFLLIFPSEVTQFNLRTAWYKARTIPLIYAVLPSLEWKPWMPPSKDY